MARVTVTVEVELSDLDDRIEKLSQDQIKEILNESCLIYGIKDAVSDNGYYLGTSINEMINDYLDVQVYLESANALIEDLFYEDEEEDVEDEG